MIAIRKKLAVNDLACIDFYEDTGKWAACIWETPENCFSVRAERVELLKCYHSEAAAYHALAFWVDFELDYIPD